MRFNRFSTDLLFCAWTLIILLAWNLWSLMRDSVTTNKRLHQIPCTNCQYFTGDYRLKCTSTALHRQLRGSD